LKQINTDIAIIGGGPAGLAAALEAAELGASKVTLIDRDLELGGILQQCIHDGFGIHRFGKRLSGNQYAQAFIDRLEQTKVEVKLDTMVLEVTPERTIYACNKNEGMIKIEAGAVILAMGCRERTANQVLIYGDRPTGIITAGAVQRYINMEGYLPGNKAVILGSGDIGLIMARRMTLEGIEVKAVYEAMSNPGGLTRNVVQCLDDFQIPLYLSTTVTGVHGHKRVEAVTVAQVDGQLNPIPDTEETVACDLLVLAVGLIPENELSRAAGIEIDPQTRGPVLDNAFMTSVPGIFACGNVAVVFDLVDYVSQSGEIAARGAIDFITGVDVKPDRYLPVVTKGNINFIVPQRLRPDYGKTTFFMRVKQPERIATLRCLSGDTELLTKRCLYLAAPEMLSFEVKQCSKSPLTIEMAAEVKR
jgi:NADPH-dependent 2,4-dienoyl-CoA reductase/sulfur reductase-like enzyme